MATVRKPIPGSIPAGAMRFIDWSSLQFYLIWIYDGAVLPQARHVRGATDNDVSCWLVRKGKVELTTGRNRVTARVGEWVFVASPTRNQSFSPDAEILSVHFHLAWPGEEPFFKRERNEVFSAAQFPELERSARRLLRLVSRYIDNPDPNLQFAPCSWDVYLRAQDLLPDWLRAYTLTMIALGHTPQRLVGTDQRSLQLVIALDRHPLSESFDEDRFAGGVGLGAKQLRSLFLKDYGLTPRRYLERRRHEAARQALAHTSTSVKSVGFSLGFRQDSHFCTWFRQREGCTPSEYRKSHYAR